MTISRIPDRQATKSRIPCPNFGESRFPGSGQIPNPVKIFFVFPNPAPYFGQIPDPENTLPDPVFRIFHKQRHAAFIKQTTYEINCNLLVKKAIFSVSNFASFMLPVDQLSYRYTIY